ncbi:hypothetical protein A374_13665 [Fictibacillus macauensis ZFHKF-1]|uniref:Uncharacterized protein n=1 Tax=Fictibacillus macauensis ZFHKF-1 TaxID=1196324 RepID=I8UD60_9BACL|nr:hypothetical protein [Fictibacillus macauensis]EIT84743.1 hypothetical protein A374_13665 [Fictibacillus macauensis ZFHKF-1]
MSVLQRWMNRKNKQSQKDIKEKIQVVERSKSSIPESKLHVSSKLFMMSKLAQAITTQKKHEMLTFPGVDEKELDRFHSMEQEIVDYTQRWLHSNYVTIVHDMYEVHTNNVYVQSQMKLLKLESATFNAAYIEPICGEIERNKQRYQHCLTLLAQHRNELMDFAATLRTYVDAWTVNVQASKELLPTIEKQTRALKDAVAKEMQSKEAFPNEAWVYEQFQFLTDEEIKAMEEKSVALREEDHFFLALLQEGNQLLSVIYAFINATQSFIQYCQNAAGKCSVVMRNMKQLTFDSSLFAREDLFVLKKSWKETYDYGNQTFQQV